MKICFIWARAFRSFNNLNLNISSSAKYRYDDATNTLHRDALEALPADFFGKSIVDVMAIVGINGSGKSNSLELLCKILKGPRSTIGCDYLVVYEDDDKLFCRYQFAADVAPTADFDIDVAPINDKIGPLKVIYFSNVFDEREHHFDAEIADISLNHAYRMRNRIRKSTVGQFGKQIRFVAEEALFERLEVQPPVRLRIAPLNRLNTMAPSTLAALKGEGFSRFRQMWRKWLPLQSPYTQLLSLMSLNLLLDVVVACRRKAPGAFSGIDQFFGLASHNLDRNSFIDRTLDYLQAVVHRDGFPVSLDTRPYGGEELSPAQIMKQIECIRSMPRWLREHDVDLLPDETRARNTFSVVFKSAAKSRISTLASLFGDADGVLVDWLGISSGEKAFINVFASIAYELKKYEKDATNILIVIDEGDLYLHPQWQMDFFDKLNTIVSSLSAQGSHVQLLLTSHSPFILSDLPRQNIAMLEPPAAAAGSDGQQLHHQTFAGNLYDLFHGPLFLRPPAISNFAKKKINDMRNEIRTLKRLSADQRDAYLRFCELIGHDIIRATLVAEIERAGQAAGARA
ncbi:hypothetical protein IA69_31570 [Massilia sp. JS1662]|nr:AAA family ATPase [Massilia sp. JS1662]KGF78229.1 hypothetical protein IA69_31570 [Massilia sp. JS1662]